MLYFFSSICVFVLVEFTSPDFTRDAIVCTAAADVAVGGPLLRQGSVECG